MSKSPLDSSTAAVGDDEKGIMKLACYPQRYRRQAEPCDAKAFHTGVDRTRQRTTRISSDVSILENEVHASELS